MDKSNENIVKNQISEINNENNDNFVYNKDNYVSGPRRIGDRTVPINILEFTHSYGYNCRKYFNLCIADPETIIFSSGNLIHFFNVKNKVLSFRRGSSEGIGHITKNPKISHITIAENGSNPPIIIYEWPSVEIVKILNGGTRKNYSCLCYSPDGQLLVSQGGKPDYLLTIWQWNNGTILLQAKNDISNQDTYNIRFSDFMAGHFATCGVEHIKFWKIEYTFTGLKLKGNLGKFGNTKMSDVIGVFFMPDGKVVSGCEWGNILMWENGLIKFEVRRKNKKPCHDHTITQFEFSNGELISVGMDGWIKVWYYDTIDQADVSEDNKFIEIEPIYEFKISVSSKNDVENIINNSMLMSMYKKYPDDPDQVLWYAQDGNGGLWLIDLSINNPQNFATKILTCHAGAITDISICTWGDFVASCGEGGNINIYNYTTNKLIISHKFRDICSKIIWLPFPVQVIGSTIICGFKSGIIRVIMADINRANNLNNNNSQGLILDKEKDVKNFKNNLIRLISIVKPHKMCITSMVISNTKQLLVTGSEDSTIFCFYIESINKYPLLIPIGFVNVPTSVSCMTWNYKTDNTILVGCHEGYCIEIELPSSPQTYTKVSYELIECKPKIFKFLLIKTAIDHNDSQLVIEHKSNKMQLIQDLETENRILTINHVDNDKIWLTIRGSDAEFIYEYSLEVFSSIDDEKIPEIPFSKRIPLSNSENIEEISSCLFYKTNNKDKYLILGIGDGRIRISQVKDDYNDISDAWFLQIHDNLNGSMTKVVLSRDNKFLFTCGIDGNIFVFLINHENMCEEFETDVAAELLQLPEGIEELDDDDDYPSLQDMITKAEQDRIQTEAKKKKETILGILRELAEEYRRIIYHNQKLIKSQQIPSKEFELDPRITDDLNDQLKNELDLVYKKMALKVEKSRLALNKLLDYFVKPITCIPFAVCRTLKPHTMVHSIKEKVLDEEFHTIYEQVQRQISEKKLITMRHHEEQNKLTMDTRDVKSSEQAEDDEEEYKIEGVESFLQGLSPLTIQNKLGTQINQMLKKYREMKARLEARAQEWKIMHENKPDLNADDLEDIKAIEEAKKSIGDYKLKVANNFSNQMSKRKTTLIKNKQFLECKKQTHLLKENFNEKLRNLRDKKLKLQKEVFNLIEKLKLIHVEIPTKYIEPLPEIVEINDDIEFPEKNLETEKYVSMAEKIREARRERQLSSEEPILQIFSAPIDEEYEVLLLDEKIIESQCKLPRFLTHYPVYKAKIDVAPDLIETLNANDQIQTPWEVEMKLARIAKKVYEQKCILNYINRSNEDIDKLLDNLEQERLQIQADSIYSELFQLTLQQELVILRDFEARENLLSEKVEVNSQNQLEVQQKIKKLSINTEQKMKEISKTNEKIKEISAQHSNTIDGNKFADFLKRIFKRKYQILKMSYDEAFSVSTTTESSEDDDDDEDDMFDDDISNTSQNFKFMNLDENICPAGCDEELYKVTLSLRTRRHEYEAKVREDQKVIDNLRKEVEKEHKKLKIVENTLDISRRELQDYMREKHRKLNDIDVTVILKLHQLQHFTGDDKFAKIHDCVIFDQNQLSKLYTRVGELQQETADQKSKHEKNRNHLHRLEMDCKYMESQIRTLRVEIKEEMFKKFGKEVSLTKLYEAVLRRMVYDIKADIKEDTRAHDKEINAAKVKYQEQIRVLEKLIQENTEKLSILTVLEEEQHKLQKILKKYPESQENILKVEQDYGDDLMKLEEILQHQKQQKELFRHEIRNLRLKSRPLPPIYPHKYQKKILHLQADQGQIEMKDFGDFNEREFYSTPEVDEDGETKNENEDKNTDEKNNFCYKMDFGVTDCDLGAINWDLKSKIDELLDIFGIKTDPNVEINMIKYLRQEDGVALAVDYIFTKLTSSNIEITTALRDYAMQTMKELKKCL